MTTAQTMLKNRLTGLVALCLGLTLGPAGCVQRERLLVPSTTTAPYDTSRGEPLLAVVPLRNESGTTAVDPLEISDKVVAAASQVLGVRTVPLNRTLAAMRALGLSDLASPAEARQLATQMGVDAIIVGSITAYDPYNPPKLGLALALYARPGSLTQLGEPLVDPRTLRYQPTEYQHFPRSNAPDAPASVISEYLDGKNQQVQSDLRNYANGRHDPSAALGWRRFLTSMDLYGEFAAWHGVHRLMDHEWLRLSGTVPGSEKKK